MSVVTAAVQAKIAGDATIAALLTTYAGVPAIFTDAPIPSDAQFPCVVTAGDLAVNSDDTINRLGLVVNRDVSIYFPRTGSAAAVESAANLIRALFHKQPLEVTGFHHVMTLVSGPVITPTSGDEVGRNLTLQIVLQNE